MTYFNTTRETGPDLARFRAQAGQQERRIIDAFEFHGEMTPSQCWALVFTDGTPITSVRRAITNLTTAGVLEKTDRKRQGHYGRPEFVWRLRAAGQDWLL